MANVNNIAKMCEQKGLECNIFPNKIFIKTNVSEWYFNPDEHGHIRLFHYNYFRSSRSSKFSNSYHIQKRRFKSGEQIVDYIYEHDRSFHKKPIRKSSLELAFEKIEQERRCASRF